MCRLCHQYWMAFCRKFNVNVKDAQWSCLSPKVNNSMFSKNAMETYFIISPIKCTGSILTNTLQYQQHPLTEVT